MVTGQAPVTLELTNAPREKTHYYYQLDARKGPALWLRPEVRLGGMKEIKGKSAKKIMLDGMS